MSSKRIELFRKQVWGYWKKEGRHTLPWRKTKDPYRVLVSEVMLQQTQVPRVIQKYKEFLRAFPNIRTLASAQLSEVLKVWSGLGYNRRGKYLHDAAKLVVNKHKGKFPRELSNLRKLPGMGPYTASAVRVFAFNEPDTLIETNIRAVYIHHFHKGQAFVLDSEIAQIAELASKDQDPRTWHSALMDYGVHIKKLYKNPARRSKHYVRQSKFDGSLRQVRGEILRRLTKGEKLKKGEKWDLALKGLLRDGLIMQEKGKWRIA